MEVMEELTPLSELNLPPILYKYRKWGGPEMRKILTDFELIFSTAKNMDDGSELNFRVEPLGWNDLRNFYKDRASKDYSHLSFEEQNRKAISGFKHSIYHDIEQVKRKVDELISVDLNNRFGVLCLCEFNTNKRLWDFLASSGTGFCVGIDTKKIATSVISGGDNMQYYQPGEEPIIRFPSIDPQNYSKDMIRIIYSLPEHLKSEREYRIVKPKPYAEIYGPESEYVKVEKEVIREVVIGYAMKIEVQRELVKIVKEKLPHAIVFRSELDTQTSQIIVNRLCN